MNKTRYFVIRVRNTLRMTQEEFADAIGRSPRTVRRWEAGETEGTMTDAFAIIKLCRDSGVDIDTIVFFYFLFLLGQSCHRQLFILCVK